MPWPLNSWTASRHKNTHTHTHRERDPIHLVPVFPMQTLSPLGCFSKVPVRDSKGWRPAVLQWQKDVFSPAIQNIKGCFTIRFYYILKEISVTRKGLRRWNPYSALNFGNFQIYHVSIPVCFGWIQSCIIFLWFCQQQHHMIVFKDENSHDWLFMFIYLCLKIIMPLWKMMRAKTIWGYFLKLLLGLN